MAALGIEPGISDRFGFDFVVNDVDDRYKQHERSLAWLGGRSAIRNPDTFGAAWLMPCTVDDVK